MDRERTCIVTREKIDPKKAIRLCVMPNGALFADLKGNFPAHGYWIIPQGKNFIQLFSQPKRFRQIKGAVRPSEDFVSQLQMQLKNRILQQIGLAKRAGQLIFGFEKVKIWLKENKAALAIVAKDGSQAEIERLGLSARNITMVQILEKEELGKALGRDKVVHIVLRETPLTENIKNDLYRYQMLIEE